MRYYKYIEDKYILYIGTGSRGGVEIKEDEYNKIMTIIKEHRKEAKADVEYKLTIDLKWVEVVYKDGAE